MTRNATRRSAGNGAKPQRARRDAAIAGAATEDSAAAQRTALLEGQRQLLASIADNAPLPETLAALVRLVEGQAAGMRCAVLLADAAGMRLQFAAAPNIPDEFKAHMEPLLQVTPGMTPCGTAAFMCHPVYSLDKPGDPLWGNVGDVAARYGMRALWSTPIVSDAGTVLGTFAMAYPEPRLPSKDHIDLIAMATQMARVAIESQRTEQLARDLFREIPGGFLITDFKGRVRRVNAAFSASLGYAPAEIQDGHLANIEPRCDYPALLRRLEAQPGQEVVEVRTYRAKDGRMQSARATSVLRHDALSHGRHVFTRIDGAASAPAAAASQLSERERQVLDHVVAGLTSREIAKLLRVSAATVDTYRSRLMVKLKVRNLSELVRFALERGLSAGTSAGAAPGRQSGAAA
jgi:PAS domain S-box-containing protein